MAPRAVVEVALHFESFRNVDLFHQGLYHLKTRVYREEASGQRLLAAPSGYFACPTQADQPRQKQGRADHHHLIPAHIIEDQCTFSTRSFLVRYCEEEVELDDIGQFRLEVDVAELKEGVALLLEVDLMFADLTQHGGADRFGEQPDVNSTEFKSVSTQTFRVHDVGQGLHEFCPVVFDEFHFCLANVVVHSVVLDLRLRQWPMDPVLAPPMLQRGSQAAEGPPSQPQLQVASGMQEVCLSLAEHMFNGGGPGTSTREEMLKAAEGMYQTHVGLLAESYAKQAAWYKLVCERCLTPVQREVCADADSAPELQLPLGMPYHPSSSSSSAGNAKGGESELLASLAARLGENVTEQAIAMHLAHDMNLVSCQVMALWQKVLNVSSYACREVASLLRMKWEEAIVDQWGVSIIRQPMTGSVPEPSDPSIGDQHTDQAENLRRTVKQASLARNFVEDLSLIPSVELRPILFEQRYVAKAAADADRQFVTTPLVLTPSSREPEVAKAAADAAGNVGKALPVLDQRIPSAPKEYRGVHLFVLVHGFQGNSFDMRLMKNNIALLYPDAIFLCSNSNEDNTEGDFSEMGIRLAQEVVNYICDWCPGSALGRISFIAHSIGGLIVRSALPLLHEYSSKMFTLITLSTPHVGYFLKNVTLFHMGLKVLQTWRQSTCLSQLSMTDAVEPRETFLYRLSQTRGLEFFQHVVLVSCQADQYSPFDSARIEVGAMQDKHPSPEAYAEMVRHIWAPVDPSQVFRFDVNFNIPEKNLDTFIGRAAHIQFLECQPIMKTIIHCYGCLFR